tara:strand:- start:3533 stop:4834 length:1302 start_codon:yes stop_codon:yes gene_type:complete
MLIRTPSLLAENKQQEYRVGFSSEIINLNTFNSSDAIFFHAISDGGLHYGIAYSSHVKANKQDQSPPSDLSFHVGKQIYESQKMQINVGMNDILYSADAKHELSLYVALLNSNILLGPQKRFILQTAIGFGTGKINHDSHNYENDLSHRARFFFGLNFHTPYLSSRGGMNILFDFDGSGMHLGATIPINKQLDIKLGMTNFQNVGDLGKYKNKTEETIFSDAAGLSVGVAFKLNRSIRPPARLASQAVEFASASNECIVLHAREEYSQPLSLNSECKDIALNEFIANINYDFTSLNDSIQLMQQINLSQNHTNAAKEYEIKMLQDSINIQYLKQRISKSELNIAMKHISQSLHYYYIGDYNLALQEIEQTIKRFPEMAIAYARKGSIFYKMGDLQQATINWNLALKHDPEYGEVREMLSSIQKEIDKISSTKN